jgi:3-methyl-2-oxobutanoate hydroxymethyltransferase
LRTETEQRGPPLFCPPRSFFHNGFIGELTTTLVLLVYTFAVPAELEGFVSTYSAPLAMPPMTVPGFMEMKRKGDKIVMVTAYDATFARIFDDAGIEAMLVGDSLGMVIQGEENTLPVTLEDMIYHTRAVRRGARRSLIVADMPFLTYHDDPNVAVHNAGRLIKEGNAHAVKLEGGAAFTNIIERMTRASIPVMGHLGLTPQSVHVLGGFKVQGKTDAARQKLIDDAKALEDAGCFSLVLEAIPFDLAEEITAALSIPTIGIGAGVGCDGQILVCYDLLGMNPNFTPKFVKRYDDLYGRIRNAAESYSSEVKKQVFPEKIHSFGVGPKAVVNG